MCVSIFKYIFIHISLYQKKNCHTLIQTIISLQIVKTLLEKHHPIQLFVQKNIAGFEDVKSACCGLGLYGATIGCLSMEMACNNTSSYVWWDLYNPTRAVNSLLADSAWSGHPFSGLCRPMNIHELLTGPASQHS